METRHEGGCHVSGLGYRRDNSSGKLAASLKGALVPFLGKVGGQVCEVGASEAGKACSGSSGVSAGFTVDEDCFLWKTMERWEFGFDCHDPGVDIERVLKLNGGLLAASRLHRGLQQG